MYEWLLSDAKLAPAEFAASFDDVLSLLPSNAHVLDCSCGTGQLAVGLAGRGMHVVATDASEAMVRRTAELSEEFGASVRTMRAGWQELLATPCRGRERQSCCSGVDGTASAPWRALGAHLPHLKTREGQRFPARHQ
nr:methyltransferase domain-containing protein [Amycolatopsis vancoresmycina]